MRIFFWHEQPGRAARLRPEVEECLHTALRPVASRIQAVAVQARDINAARGGSDQQCRLTAHLKWGEVITVSQRQPDLQAALRIAADRLTETVARSVRRRQQQRRQTTMAGQTTSRRGRTLRHRRAQRGLAASE